MTPLKLSINGMSCGHCLNAVNKSLSALEGVKLVSVGIGKAELEFDEGRTDVAAIVKAVEEAGYPAAAV
ncbi:MAG: heavy-metal-associated domain-containing protein [Gemmatimonadales bacterium]